jgi:hypothetical protein
LKFVEATPVNTGAVERGAVRSYEVEEGKEVRKESLIIEKQFKESAKTSNPKAMSNKVILSEI